MTIKASLDEVFRERAHRADQACTTPDLPWVDPDAVTEKHVYAESEEQLLRQRAGRLSVWRLPPRLAQ